MSHTFEIRFGRAAGWSSLFDASENSFGWRGGGLLSIDAQGMSIALKRGLASLLSRHRTQRIPAESIREVYREGEALRVEFPDEANALTQLPFWVRDRETAAQIVQLLPTSRTFEVELDASELEKKPTARRARWIGPMAGVLVLAGGALIFDM